MSAHNEGYEQLYADGSLVDPGTGKYVNINKSPAVLSIVSAAAETRKVAAPARAGLELSIGLDVDGGTVTVTFDSAINVTGNTIATLDTAGEFLTLKSVKIAGAFRWSVIANPDSIGLS